MSGSKVFAALTAEIGKAAPSGTLYWWNTTGRNLADMLRVAKYPEPAKHGFLSFYRNQICGRLGSPPTSTSVKSGMTYDGTPIEYSYSFNASTKLPTVRFVVDLNPLREPSDANPPLSTAAMQDVVQAFAARNSKADTTWYHGLKRYFDVKSEPAKVKEIIAQAGHQSPEMLGFDIHRKIKSNEVPATGKLYFLPCLAAAERGITRWKAVTGAIKQLPEIETMPNMLTSLSLIEAYLASKPEEWQQGARYLSTDLLPPSESRIKVYLRCPGDTFAEMWDFYTLGGRLTGLDDDKEMFRDLFRLVMGAEDGPDPGKVPEIASGLETRVRRKLTTIYFSLSNDSVTPTPKLCFCAKNFAHDDGVVARGLEKWFRKYGWTDPEVNAYDKDLKEVL